MEMIEPYIPTCDDCGEELNYQEKEEDVGIFFQGWWCESCDKEL